MINLLVAGITLLVIVGLLMGRNGALTLIDLSIAPPLMWVNVVFGRRLREKTRKSRESDSAFTSSVQRSMSAVVLTKRSGGKKMSTIALAPARGGVCALGSVSTGRKWLML